jgi:hypothetical protein
MGWSYVPCHWMGFVIIGVLVGALLVVVGILALASELLNAPWINHGSIAAFLVFWAVGMRIAHRHSR